MKNLFVAISGLVLLWCQFSNSAPSPQVLKSRPSKPEIVVFDLLETESKEAEPEHEPGDSEFKNWDDVDRDSSEEEVQPLGPGYRLAFLEQSWPFDFDYSLGEKGRVKTSTLFSTPNSEDNDQPVENKIIAEERAENQSEPFKSPITSTENGSR